jgi:proteasome accessory factor A
MAERLFGVETEYAINGMRGQVAVDREPIVRRLLELARSTLPHLRDGSSSGVFLQNAARLYIDCGLHIEYSTPECTNPWDAVRYVEAGHATMLELIRKFAKSRYREEETACFRVNVDYSGNGSTWGCHESYLHKMPLEELPPQLIPHLVSRIVYTGAGGFQPLSGGLRFTLSPRASLIERTVSSDSTGSRGIFHTKDEALCTGYHRLHILCGENLCSQEAMFVKFGATGLVVAMAEAGLGPGEEVQLVAPIEALRVVAGDPTCKKTLRVKGSPGMTAIEIQRRYLAMAEAHVDEPFMPPWARTVCRHWRGVLDLLERGPGAVCKVLDWAIKLALYAHHASSRDLDWGRLPFWADAVDSHLRAVELPPGDGQIPLDLALGPETPVPNAVAELDALVEARGLNWDELRRAQAYRAEFLELDTRFGQLGPRGVFTTLDDGGVLDHRVPGVDNIEHALLNPPSSGRANVRGGVVRRVAADKDGAWYCDWHRIYSNKYGRLLDLSDPFAASESWHDVPPRTRLSQLDDLLDEPF